ncbi:MAG: hypothetical protein AB8D52_00185 [Gammaproteobacteria bacterium]
MKIGIVVPTLLIATAFGLSTQAAEYTATPYAKARLDADTNRRLTAQDEDTTTGTGLEGGVVMTAGTEKSTYSLTPRFNIARYSGDGNGFDQDIDNYFIDWSSSHLLSERFSAGTTFTYANSGVVGTELDDLGLVLNGDNNFATEVGVITENFSRETISGGGSVSYIYDEKNSFSIGGNYGETEYDNNTTGLADFENQSINASWTHQLSETDQISLSVYASQQDFEQDFLLESSVRNGLSSSSIDRSSDETGISLGYIHSFSDTLVGRFNVGTRSTDSEFADLVDFDIQLSPASGALVGSNVINRADPLLTDAAFLQANPTFLQGSRTVNRAYQQGKNNGSGLTLDASVEKLYDDKTTITAGATRGTQVTGVGVSENEELYLRGIYLWSDRITANGSFRYFTIETLNESTLFPNAGKSDQIRLELALDYRWTEFWTVGAGYSYREIERDDGGSADGHGIFFTLGYNGNTYSRSR